MGDWTNVGWTTGLGAVSAGSTSGDDEKLWGGGDRGVRHEFEVTYVNPDIVSILTGDASERPVMAILRRCEHCEGSGKDPEDGWYCNPCEGRGGFDALTDEPVSWRVFDA